MGCADYHRMDCEFFRACISARLDGEDPGVDEAALAWHLAQCAGCRAFESKTISLNRAVRLHAAEAVPDFSPTILAAVRTPTRPAADLVPVRAALLSVAIVQFILAAPAFLLGVDGNAPIHIAREVGSFDLALVAGFAFCAWRPARAYGIFPLVAALVGCLAIGTTVDILQGHTSLGGESVHLLELFGLLMVWRLTRGNSRPNRRSPLRPPSPSPAIR